MDQPKKIKEKSIGNFGWRSYRITVDPIVAARRLKRCPVPSVRQKMAIAVSDLQNPVRFNAGMGGDETECARWILCNRVPDDRILTEPNREAIFAWVRETL